MKKIYAVIVFALMAAVLSGCFPSGDIEVVDAEYENVLEKAENTNNFSLNIDIPQNTPDTVPTLYTELETWNMSDLYNIFNADTNDIIHNYEYPSNHFSELTRYITLFSNETLGADYGDLYYTLHDNITDSYGDKVLSQIGAVSYLNLYRYDYADYDKELSAYSKEEVLSATADYLNNLEITNIGEPSVYPVTKEYAAKAVDSSVEELGWEDTDEVYYIVYPFSFGGIELCEEELNIIGTDYFLTTHSYASFIISAKQIVQFECHLYSDNYYFSEESEEIISAVNAAGILTDYYANKENLSKYEFNTMKLVYVPVDLNNTGFVYEPAWLFEGVETVTQYNVDYKHKICELIYAKTGIRYNYYG